MTAATIDSFEDSVRIQKVGQGHCNISPRDPPEFDGDEISASCGKLASISASLPSRTKTSLHSANTLDEIPEEECWLFKPHELTGSPSFLSNTSCLQWAREVFDSPSSEFYHHRCDLLYRLEVILTTEPAKRLPNLGGSVPALNMASNISQPSLSKTRLIGGGSEQNFGPGSTATFVRPKRHASEMLPQHARQRSSPGGTNSPVPVKPSGSTDDLQNVADLQTIARKQEDELKAEVAAISAYQHASRMGSSQQSLNSANRSGPESPYASQSRLNVSSSPTPSDIAKQQMTSLRLSLDSHRQAMYCRGESNEDLVGGGGEASIPGRTLPPPPSMPTLRYSVDSPQPPIGGSSTENILSPGGQQAVIVGRSNKIPSRLPGPIRRQYLDKGPRFPSNEALPSYGWSDAKQPGFVKRSSQEQLSSRRIPVPPPRSGSALTGGVYHQ
uniref:SLAIN motif-containing protein 2 n=1 Tax=Mesocestoides corti TaxID=53468 RepID=A0A5K3EN39_MESCO